ncbi:hypothetical protein ACVBEH_23700, partial [Roseateles sp. GG27B]
MNIDKPHPVASRPIRAKPTRFNNIGRTVALALSAVTVSGASYAIDYGPFSLTGFAKAEIQSGSNHCVDCQRFPAEDKQRFWADELEIGTGAYWQGKGLQRITQLMNVVEQQGDLDGRDKLLKLSQKRIEDWFSGDSSKTYFHYDKALGTVVAYPEEYF